MKEIPDLNGSQRTKLERFFRWMTSRKILPRLLLGVALAATVVTTIYTRVNHRGQRLWDECKREIAAKGDAWEWSAYVPGPVPDDQNMFKAPGMDLFLDDRSIKFAPLDHPVTNDFAQRLMANFSSNNIVTAETAADYLGRTDQFQTEFDKIRTALKRPFARIVADYSQPLSMQFPNSATWSGVVLVLEQRSKCHLLVGQAQKAWDDLALLWDLRRLVESQGKFITTEGAWMVRGSTRHALTVAAQGLQTHAWSESQLLELQSRLSDTDAIARFTDALKCGRALVFSATVNGTLLKAEFAAGGANQKILAILAWLAPHGIMYEKLCSKQRDWQRMINVLASSNSVVAPESANAAFAWWKRAQEGLPGLLRDQTMINEGQIACALERYLLAHHEYPAALDALVPKFIQRLPHDIINGQPLRYRRTDSGGFLLYSVGWNATDDGGQISTNATQSLQIQSGDWVW